MKRLINLFLGVMMLAVLLAACSPASAPKGTALEGADRDQVLAYSEPLAEKTMLSLNGGDYSAFSEDLNDRMKAAMPQDAFDKLRSQLSNAVGAYQSRTVDRVVDYGEFITVYYKVQYEKKAGTMNMSFSKNEPHQISGMYFQ